MGAELLNSTCPTHEAGSQKPRQRLLTEDSHHSPSFPTRSIIIKGPSCHWESKHMSSNWFSSCFRAMCSPWQVPKRLIIQCVCGDTLNCFQRYFSKYSITIIFNNTNSTKSILTHEVVKQQNEVKQPEQKNIPFSLLTLLPPPQNYRNKEWLG